MLHIGCSVYASSNSDADRAGSGGLRALNAMR
jgi:hypothetical protein